MRKTGLITCLLLCLAACRQIPAGDTSTPTPTPPPAPTPTPTPTPAPTLEPAGTFIPGVSEFPPGQYLLVTIHPWSGCTWECMCPVVEPPRPAYSLDAGNLRIDILDDNGLEPGWQVLQMDPQPVGFMGYGEYSEHMDTIPRLPFVSSDDSTVTILSVESDGTIIIQIGEETYRMAPGQFWQTSGTVEQETPAGCITTYTYTIVNRGLLEAAQINPPR